MITELLTLGCALGGIFVGILLILIALLALAYRYFGKWANSDDVSPISLIMYAVIFVWGSFTGKRGPRN